MKNAIFSYSKKCLWCLFVWLTVNLVLPGSAETINYSYDDAGRVIGVFYGDGTTLTYVYDAAGNLLRETRTHFVDSDHDGMDDAWETNNFTNLSHDGTLDFDGDGQTDLQEYMAGTNPTSALSVLKILQITSTPKVSFSIQWASVSGRYYRVQYNDTLQPDGWKNLGGDILATGDSATKTDSSIASQTRRFYRVVSLF